MIHNLELHIAYTPNNDFAKIDIFEEYFELKLASHFCLNIDLLVSIEQTVYVEYED